MFLLLWIIIIILFPMRREKQLLPILSKSSEYTHVLIKIYRLPSEGNNNDGCMDGWI
jgi:hypothetical protein